MNQKNQNLKEKEKRSIFFGAVRLTKTEFNLVETDYQKSPHISRSAYMRAKIFDKKISNAQQKKHQAFLQAAKLNTEINKIGNNFNQLVHGINTYKLVELKKNEVEVLQKLSQQLEKLQQIFDEIDL